ncbi:MAG: alpha-L-rhamnosidase [Acidobacteriota bacterium]|nr:alpha-L-rhamnosidase [Acidobacteriota bacterium]
MRVCSSAMLLILVLSVSDGAWGVGQHAPAVLPEQSETPWVASWITSPDGPQRDASVLRFRKELELAQAPQHFGVQVSADNQFILYVNGTRVGFGPARSDLGHWKYESYDLAPFLHAGTNTLAATVWNFGVQTPLSQISDRLGFVVQGKGQAERAANTDTTWQVEEEKGIAVLPTPHEVLKRYYVAEPAERLDGRILDWNWNTGNVFGASWKQAHAIGLATLQGSNTQENNWQLMADSLPPMEYEKRAAGRVVRSEGIASVSGFPDGGLSVLAHAKVSILLDNLHLTTAFPELTVSQGRGATIRLTYAEAMFGAEGKKGNRNEIAGKHIVGVFDEFVADGGRERVFEPLGWKTWRYLQVDIETGDQPLEIEKLQTWFTAFPFEERGHFASNDESLKPIWDIGWRTARLDAHDTYMDTPYYERMQYVGDTRIQALISYTVAGDDRLARQAIEAFNYSRIPEGVTRSRYPSSVRQIIPTFSLMWVGMVHDFWMYRSDEAFVQRQLAGTRTVMDWFLERQRADGLLGYIPWWPFVDWGEGFGGGSPPQDAEGGSSVVTLQFVEALRYAAELETALGDKGRAQTYRSAADRGANAVHQCCWNSQYGLLADTAEQKHYSQHANILGVWLDVISKERQKGVLRKILSSSDAGYAVTESVPTMTNATYYFRFYLARAIDHAGMGDDYLRLLGPWRQMVSLGLTTWAEQPEPTRSDSHAWSAHPNYDFLTIVAGIRPGAPGFRSITIAPHLGSLQHLTATMPHAGGNIEAEYTVHGGVVHAGITLPAGSTGHLEWRGRTLPMHAGRQELQLSAQ